MVEGVRQKLTQQMGAWLRFGMAIPAPLQHWFDAQVTVLDSMESACLRGIVKEWKGTAIGEWVKATHGLGPATLLVLSLAPELSRFPNPAKFWKYIGLSADRTTDRRYNKRLKAWCLYRIADPCVKSRSPYRAVYDARRANHPEMLPAGQCAGCDAAYAKRKVTGTAGWDCRNVGGPHWKLGHSHIDALGVLAKAVLLDAWRIAHDLSPRLGAKYRMSPTGILPQLPSHSVS